LPFFSPIRQTSIHEQWLHDFIVRIERYRVLSKRGI
jgi:hypothetical protein